MHCEKRITFRTDWNGCPPEILWTVFKYLDTKSLTQCMLVNYKWKDVAEKMAEVYQLWEKIVKCQLSNKGASFLYKSKLSWRNIYKNAMLWNHIAAAHIKVVNIYDIKDIKKINVYNGKFIALDGSCAAYYDMTTFEKVSQTVCVDLEENDKMVAKLSHDYRDRRQLNLCIETKKVNPSEAPQLFRSKSRYGINGILMFKLAGDTCYSVSKDNVVTVLTSKGNEHVMELLGRCFTSDYDPVIDIHLWNEAGFLISKLGSIWSFTSLASGIQKVHKMPASDDISNHNWAMFDKFSSAIPVTGNGNERVTMVYDEDSDSVTLQCNELTSAMAHCDVLLLGYRDGTVEIHLPKKNIRSAKPERFFNIREFSNNDENCMIVALNVYEIENAHILLVCTNTNVYQFQLTYPDDILHLYV